MDIAELNEEWFRHMVSQTGEVRPDIWALLSFVNARGFGGAVDETKAIDLFWEIVKPQVHYMGSQWFVHLAEETPPLLEEVETALLENLAEQERACRLAGYSPDLEDPVDSVAACQYIHVGAASALRHRVRDGFSDYVRQTLNEVSRVLRLYLPSDSWQELQRRGLDGLTASTVSAFGVKSLVLSESSQIKCLNGEYEEAFEMAVDAAVSAQAVVFEADIGPFPDREYFGEKYGEENVDVELATRAEIVRLFDAKVVEPQYVVDAFEELRKLGRIESWRRLANGCNALARLARMWGESVIGEDGNEESWSEYWPRAEGWAMAQLSPNDLREFMRDQERDASEQRLKSYFFGEVWDNLPEKARESLINVDSLWFTATRGTNVGAVLNDLQVAAETMCYQYIWEPLREAPGGQALLEFKKKDVELSEERKSPTLADYAWACRRQFFKEFLDSGQVSEDDRRFLLQRLSRALNDLNKSRNRSQHDPNVRLQRQDVEPFVKMFLGIGQPGVLPRLAEIGSRLARR